MSLLFDTVHDVGNSMKIEVQKVDAFKEQMETQCPCLGYDGVAIQLSMPIVPLSASLSWILMLVADQGVGDQVLILAQ